MQFFFKKIKLYFYKDVLTNALHYWNMLLIMKLLISNMFSADYST